MRNVKVTTGSAECWVLRQGFRIGNEEYEVENEEGPRKWLTISSRVILEVARVGC
jgi:hypothetical protein